MVKFGSGSRQSQTGSGISVNLRLDTDQVNIRPDTDPLNLVQDQDHLRPDPQMDRVNF